MDHAESISQPDVATLGRKMDGWSRQAQAQEICKSVLFAQLHSLFIDFICHGSSEQVHSDTVSCILSDKIPSRINKVYHHTFDLTRNVASTSAWPAAISGAANTFILSFRIISCVAHLKKQRALDTSEHIRSRTHFIPIATSGMDDWHRNSWDLKSKHHRGTWLPNQTLDFIS